MTTQTEIARVTGLSPKVQDEILEQVKANRAKLESCSGPHDFSVCLDRRTKQPIQNPTPEQHFGARWRCSKCGGNVDVGDKMWYSLGLNHVKELQEENEILKKQNASLGGAILRVRDAINET